MKKIFITLVSFLILLFLIIINYETIKKTNTFYSIKRYLSLNLHPDVSTFIRIITNVDGNLFAHYNNDYLVKFLPRTQFINNIDLKKVKLNFLKKSKFSYRYSFELINNHLIIATNNGQFYIERIDTVINKDEEQINFKELKTNLYDLILPENLIDSAVSDIFVDAENIYILVHEIIDNCKKIQLLVGSFNLNSISFEEVFSTKSIIKCVSKDTNAGRVQKLKTDKKEVLLVTFSNKAANGEVHKELTELETESDDEFGNIISINKQNKDFAIYARGLRNSLGLYVDEKVILATDNGPKGGDEINKIIKGEHYGWPYSSYGSKYYDNGKTLYKMSHNNFGFQEPIYSFIYALGIAEIIKLDNNFAEMWQNNFLVSTMNGNHLLRIRFDNNFDKIIYNEKIFIGERVRDLKYDSKNKKIFIGLNSSGSLGIISNLNR